MLRQRLVTGSLLIAGLLGLLWLDGAIDYWLAGYCPSLPPWLRGNDGILLRFVAVFGLAPLLGVELARMLRGSGIAAPAWLTVLAAMVGTLVTTLMPLLANPHEAVRVAGTAIYLTLFLAFVAHARHQRVAGVVSATGGTLLSFVYIGVMLGMWLVVRQEVGPWVVAGAMLTVKSSDSGAYFTGHAIGKHKLIPWLSPGKTWEGFVGGIVAAAGVGALLSWWSASLPDARDHVPVVLGALGGALLGIVGPCGDLVESLLKRSGGMKDSGTLLPGMGGVFDVLDSLLLAGPVVYWLLELRAFPA